MKKSFIVVITGLITVVFCCNSLKSLALEISYKYINNTVDSLTNSSQLNDSELKKSFEVLIRHFQKQKTNEFNFLKKIGEKVDSCDYIIRPPLLWESSMNTKKESRIKVEISDNPITIKTKELVLENPNGDDFPVSYSVIYQDRLISLFQSGNFVCHSIYSMQRDLSFEEKINTQKFDYHWLLDNKFVGISNEKYFYLNADDKWVEYDDNIPLKNQPKLYEDDTYISFCDCEGEFGGTVYFYNKVSRKIYYTSATCANTVYMKDGKYYVLSEIIHMLGFTNLKEIANPDQLTSIDLKTIHNHQYGKEAKEIGYSDKSNASNNIFNFSEIVFHSTFNYKGKTVYLAYLPHVSRTFLAEVENNTVKVINPLFNNSLFVHYPLTTSYPNAILINGAYYRTGGKKEVSCIIIKDDEFILIDWNKKHR